MEIRVSSQQICLNYGPQWTLWKCLICSCFSGSVIELKINNKGKITLFMNSALIESFENRVT